MSSKKADGIIQAWSGRVSTRGKWGNFGRFLKRRNKRTENLEERMERKDPRVSELPMISKSFELGKRRMMMEGNEDVKHDF